VEAKSTGDQGSRRAVVPSDDDDSLLTVGTDYFVSRRFIVILFLGFIFLPAPSNTHS
jgi:hypothetical protein